MLAIIVNLDRHMSAWNAIPVSTQTALAVFHHEIWTQSSKFCDNLSRLPLHPEPRCSGPPPGSAKGHQLFFSSRSMAPSSRTAGTSISNLFLPFCKASQHNNIRQLASTKLLGPPYKCQHTRTAHIYILGVACSIATQRSLSSASKSCI